MHDELITIDYTMHDEPNLKYENDRNDDFADKKLHTLCFNARHYVRYRQFL